MFPQNFRSFYLCCKLISGEIPVLRLKSLKRIGDMLTEEECYKIGTKFRIKSYTLKDIRSKPNFHHKIFEEWREIHTKPNKSLVEVLADILEDIDRMQEAEIVRKAYADKTEFNVTIC